MTRPPKDPKASRRHKNVKSFSVIDGLHMEPALAAAVTAKAHELAGNPPDAKLAIVRASISETVKAILRHQLKIQGQPPGPSKQSKTPVAGLRCDPALLYALQKKQQQTNLTMAGLVRHLLRTALDIKNSLETERRFSMIREAKRGLMEETSE